MRKRFQFDSSVSWMVIFLHIFGQNTLISLCLDSQPAKIMKKNMSERFGMESLSDIWSYHCGGGWFCGYFFGLWSMFPLWKCCPPLWVKQTVKPVATQASSNKEIKRGCNSKPNQTILNQTNTKSSLKLPKQVRSWWNFHRSFRWMLSQTKPNHTKPTLNLL